MNKASVVRGIIIPNNWDNQDNVISIAISAVGEREYSIEMNGMGKNLMKHISREVRLAGLIYKNSDSNRDTIKVQVYELLNRNA